MIPLVEERSEDWFYSPLGDKRGYIRPHALDELWFHTGTHCNLECNFCLEGSGPNDNRLAQPTLDDVKPFIKEALEMDVKKFSFTGGEPFSNKNFIEILGYASKKRPCLVLTNGTKPLQNALPELLALKAEADTHQIDFRISIDHPEADAHNAGRGAGNFERAIDGMRKLHAAGFSVSLARHINTGEDAPVVERAYQSLFEQNALPKDTKIVAFPDFLRPGSIAEVPYVTTDCMVRYQNEDQRRAYMCASSKMVIKYQGKMAVYACTLVDDDPEYDLGSTLKEAMELDVSLKHHRCYSCFAHGASCSES